MKSLDTYSPTELGKFLSEAKLEGRKIAGVESASVVFSSIGEGCECRYICQEKAHDKSATVDRPIILTFDNGEKIAIDFSAISHVRATLYPADEIAHEMDDVDFRDGDVTICRLFSKELIGKTICEFMIDATDDANEAFKNLDFADDGLDENQASFIMRLSLILTNASQVCFMVSGDFTVFEYTEK